MLSIFPKLAKPETLFGMEWLITGDSGAYSSASALGASTRKYHGVLACPNPENISQRIMALQKLDEKLVIENGPAIELDTNFYPGAIYPKGYEQIRRADFSENRASYSYEGDFGKLAKTISMLPGDTGVKVNYSFDFTRKMTLEIIPKFNHRNIHAVGKQAYAECEFFPAGFCTKNGLLDMISPDSDFERHDETYRACTYPQEAKRGYESTEDLYSPGFFKKSAKSGKITIYAKAFFRHSRKEKARMSAVWENAEKTSANGDWFLAQMHLSCGKFMTTLPNGDMTALAGYPWFFEWARDAMIFIDGALLPFGRHAHAKAILSHFALMQ
ncbi:MAG TPA: glycogen debranching enzyme N-terminal domain-containing protein, partial [Candidatus Micrarchaeota archaeon]|nr:glycogen debranching enzyme N-terminal domain-containing protein [Candidatus Micrarchaeota archaeon]